MSLNGLSRTSFLVSTGSSVTAAIAAKDAASVTFARAATPEGRRFTGERPSRRRDDSFDAMRPAPFERCRGSWRFLQGGTSC